MKARLYGRDWEMDHEHRLGYRGAEVNTRTGLGWVTPHGALLDTHDPRGVRQFECLFRAEYHSEVELVEWLAEQGYDHVRGTEGLGVLIGVPDPAGLDVPLQFRASGPTLRDAVRDLAGRL